MVRVAVCMAPLAPSWRRRLFGSLGQRHLREDASSAVVTQWGCSAEAFSAREEYGRRFYEVADRMYGTMRGWDSRGCGIAVGRNFPLQRVMAGKSRSECAAGTKQVLYTAVKDGPNERRGKPMRPRAIQ
jgi:hypothetical protein